MLTRRQIEQYSNDVSRIMAPVHLKNLGLLLLSNVVSVLLALHFKLSVFIPITVYVVSCFGIPFVTLRWKSNKEAVERFRQLAICCPFCNAPFQSGLVLRWTSEFRSGKRKRVLPQTHCPNCGQQVVDLPVRSQAARERLSAHQTWVCLQRIHWYLWGFVFLQLIFVYGYYFSHLAPYFIVPEKFALSLFGVGIDVCSIFLWFRSRNPRCRYPCFVSILLTTYMFINAWTDFTASTVR